MTEATTPIEPTVYRLGDQLVEPELNRLSREGQELQLEAKTMDMLAHLIEHHGGRRHAMQPGCWRRWSTDEW